MDSLEYHSTDCRQLLVLRIMIGAGCRQLNRDRSMGNVALGLSVNFN